MSNALATGDRVRFKLGHCEGRTGTIVNIMRDCAGLLYYVKLDGEPLKAGDRGLQIVDSHRAGLRKIERGLAPPAPRMKGKTT
jgi:hypothetical protein